MSRRHPNEGSGRVRGHAPGKPIRRIVRHRWLALSGLILLVCLLAMLTVGARPSDAAAPPQGLATFELIERLPAPGEGVENLETALSTFGDDGTSLHRLLKTHFESSGLSLDFFGRISFSPDGSEIALTAEARSEDPSSRAIYLIDTDGADLHRLPGTVRGAEPLFSPDGTTLAFTRSKFRSPKIDFEKFPPIRGKGYSSTTTWILDLATGKARRLTPWRNELAIRPGSFSPDGQDIALTRSDGHRRGPEILLRALDSGSTRVVTDLGEEPSFSPDGRKLTFVGYQHPVRIHAEENQDYVIGDLYTIGVGGDGLRRLTRNRAIEASPAWSPSGDRIAFVEAEPDESWIPGLANLFPSGNRIRVMNVDGTCAKTVRSSHHVALFGVAWQPGSPTVTRASC
jgi:Tol biopolymer transport system component